MNRGALIQLSLLVSAMTLSTHIETYWVPRYVDAAMNELTKFFARTIGA